MLEQSSVSSSVEKPHFSDQARNALTKRGFVIYELTGITLSDHRRAGQKMWSNYYEGDTIQGNPIDERPSRISEVAIHPDSNKLFVSSVNDVGKDKQSIQEEGYPLPKGSFVTQENILESKYPSRRLRGIADVHAEIGSAPDVVEVVFSHYEQTGERLLGKPYGFAYTRTETPVLGNRYILGGEEDAFIVPEVVELRQDQTIIVGSFDEKYGLGIDNFPKGQADYFVELMPLVFPGKLTQES